MLTLKSLVAFVAVAVFSVTAAPAPGPSPSPGESSTGFISTAEATDIETRGVVETRDDNARVRVCKNHFFQGDCLTYSLPQGLCLGNMSTEWNDVISSYEVINRSEWYCQFYEHASCQGARYDAQIDDTLHDGNGAWADRITSIKCAIVSLGFSLVLSKYGNE
ncbi:hypothetical protein V8F33_009930 [Rhypophila sp. PSN 637]